MINSISEGSDGDYNALIPPAPSAPVLRVWVHVWIVTLGFLESPEPEVWNVPTWYSPAMQGQVIIITFLFYLEMLP